jgi:hypothetical protein
MSRANCGVASSQLIRTLFFSFDQERELRLELKEATSEAEQVSILFNFLILSLTPSLIIKPYCLTAANSNKAHCFSFLTLD